MNGGVRSEWLRRAQCHRGLSAFLRCFFFGGWGRTIKGSIQTLLAREVAEVNEKPQ